MPTSTAYLLIREASGKNRRITFDGVVSISHALTLKISKESEASEDADLVNNARNEPDVVTLSVTASDAGSGVPGGAEELLRTLAEIKEKRKLCEVVTRLRTNTNMLLTELSILRDETCPYGWTGTLTFTQTAPAKTKKKEDDRSSSPSHKGTSSPKKPAGAGGKDSVLLTLFRERGIPTG